MLQLQTDKSQWIKKNKPGHIVCKGRQLYFFLSNIFMPFISFCCLITVTITSTTMLNRWDENGYFCFVPKHRMEMFKNQHFYTKQAVANRF